MCFVAVSNSADLHGMIVNALLLSLCICEVSTCTATICTHSWSDFAEDKMLMHNDFCPAWQHSNCQVVP